MPASGPCVTWRWSVLLDVVVRAEEPEAIFQKVAADVGAVVGSREADRNALGRNLVEVLVLRLEAVVVPVAEHVAVELVASGLGDDVEDAALGAGVLGLVASGLDLHFLDELEVHDLALVADLDAGRVGAVHHVGVLEARRTVHGDRRLARVRRVRVDAARELRDRGVVAPGGKRLEGCRVHRSADRVRLGLDGGRLRGHGDRLGLRLQELQPHDRGLAQRELERLRLRRKSVERRRDRVRARGKQREVESAVAVGDGAPAPLQVRAPGFDRDSGKRCAAGLDRAADRSRRLRTERKGETRGGAPGRRADAPGSLHGDSFTESLLALR